MEITTRCHSCAMAFEVDIDESAIGSEVEKWGRRYFELDSERSVVITCPNCGRHHYDGFDMEYVFLD